MFTRPAPRTTAPDRHADGRQRPGRRQFADARPLSAAGSDLTEAIKHGYQGLNFAFFAGFDAYHAASDTPTATGMQRFNIGGELPRPALAQSHPARPRPRPALRRPRGRPGAAIPGRGGLGPDRPGAHGSVGLRLQVARQGRLSPRGVAASAGAFALLILVLGGVLWALGETRWAMAGAMPRPCDAPRARHPRGVGRWAAAWPFVVRRRHPLAQAVQPADRRPGAGGRGGGGGPSNRAAGRPSSWFGHGDGGRRPGAGQPGPAVDRGHASPWRP